VQLLFSVFTERCWHVYVNHHMATVLI